MNMEKIPPRVLKGVIAALGIIFLLLILRGLLLRVRGEGQPQKIDGEIIRQYENGSGEAKFALVSFIAGQAGFAEDIKNLKNENISLALRYGSVLGNSLEGAERDIVVTVGYPGHGVISVLKKEKDQTYEFAGVVDSFFELGAVQLIPVKNSGKDIIVVREYVDLLEEAGEQSVYLRGYYWDKKNFNLVLNITEEQKVYWPENNEEKQIARLMQKSKTAWEDSIYPAVKVAAQQSLGWHPDNGTDVPDGAFEVTEAVETSQVYYWHKDWNYFILYEGVDAKTGEQVAVLEDLSQSMYTLREPDVSGYRILKKNGAVEIVNAQRIKDIKQVVNVSEA